jgi:hypothetical protein
MTPIEMLRSIEAQRSAVKQYERAARRLFDLEDACADVGAPELAAVFHRHGVIAGHAAWNELTDREPRRSA